ncbi:NmrA/HSCARG family protein [Actinoplanes sp. L3-i22]|uniref:NmrA/HSCARG family protein n=1 Tax=Actinoplanes sp. L3-i22 TaxID=2836373 RepID=UPI001C783120|nr:NmrA/HSCARG family protein [Actinoplanes sp. L3-i22]BCY09234.1 nucleotide-diphosphate-sugar epimerase [Actinoplanes sp. L3-i22]
MASKTIAVVGATGAQGNGVVRAILAAGGDDFNVRALTRDVTSAKARELAELGAEVVVGDYSSPEGLAEAFAGADGAFLVTDFWTHMDPEKEQAYVRNLIDAVQKAGVKHVVWSTLEDTRELIPVDDPRMPTLLGTYKVPHFDAKAEADEFFRVAGVPTTFLRTTFYYENLADALAPARDGEGRLVLNIPMGDAPLAGIASGDIGRVALSIFRGGSEYVGRTVSIAGDVLTGKEIAEALADALGEPVEYRPVTHDQFRAFGFPGADEYGNMLQYYTEFAAEFTGPRDPAKVRELTPEVRSLREWLAEVGYRLPNAA